MNAWDGGDTLSWEEKSYYFEKRYFQGRYSKDLWKYIPNNIVDAVNDVYVNQDGYWIGLHPGYTAYDGGVEGHTIHEYLIEDLKQAIKTIREEK